MSKKIKKIKWLYHQIGVKAAFYIGFIPLFAKDYKKAVTKNTIRYFKSFAYQAAEKKEDTSIDFIEENAPIWTCWWQGQEAMPEVVQLCHNSLLHHAGKHPVKLITLNNYMEYVDIPSFILEKVEKGIITYTHLSDILRFCLLSKYGGLWLDATIFVTQNIREIAMPIFSLKQKPMDDLHVSMYRWTSFCLGGVKHSPLYVFGRDVFFKYWKFSNSLLEYLMVDDVIAAAYEKIPEVKKSIDDIPYNNRQLYAFSHILNKPFDEYIYMDVSTDTCFHKFTWKSSFYRTDANGHETLYGYLLRLYKQ